MGWASGLHSLTRDQSTGDELMSEVSQQKADGRGKVRQLDPPEPYKCVQCGETFLRSQTRVRICDHCRDVNKLLRTTAWSRAALADPEKNARINARRRELNNRPERKQEILAMQRARLARETPEAREERLAKMRIYGRSNKPNRRAAKYGMTPEQIERLTFLQDGKCAICGTDSPGGRYDQWAVDHCHVTGSVRGLLCTACNAGLGQFKDDALLLQKAIRYLNGGNADLVGAILHGTDEGIEHGGCSDASSTANT